MDIFAAFILVALGGLLGSSVSALYRMYDKAWHEDEEAKEKLRQRMNSIEDRMAYAYFLIGEYDNRLKKLEPSEVAE
jgi:hypothetical protein